MKLNNLKITPKLGILVGVTLLGLCVAGVLAGYLMQRRCSTRASSRPRSIVEMARNMAGELKKAGRCRQAHQGAAMAELRQARQRDDL